MPHCIIEYTSNISDLPDFTKLLRDVNQMLVSTELFKLNDIKTRIIKHNLYLIGDGDSKRAFITMNLQILDGRSDDVKVDLSRKALAILKQYFPKTLLHYKASLTVQITDIHSLSYSKEISE